MESIADIRISKLSNRKNDLHTSNFLFFVKAFWKGKIRGKRFVGRNEDEASDILKPLIEVVSKPHIRFKGKAHADRESAAHIGM